MKIKVNGEYLNYNGENLTVAKLLSLKNVEDIDTVVVQLNGEFLDKSKYHEIVLKDNDEIEYLYFVGGGSS
ncbi:sulfur carrier protein ThiS [Deferribacter thermophilus]|uniref:sulfur carrier protein ThiS n=1 Tax=Deferribacter thermophilus TaxID=53573 RepID=UPI003C25FB40